MSREFEPETKAKAKSKKGKREPTSLHVDPELWQEVRVMAVLRNKSVTQYFEEALRAKLDIDSRDGKYPVGHGGMYIPPPPSSSPRTTENQEQIQQPQPQNQQKELLQEHIQNQTLNQVYYKIVKSPLTITLNLPGIKFPVNRNEIMKYAEKANAEGIITIIRKQLPEKTYKNKLEIENEILNIIKNFSSSMSYYVETERIKLIIDDRELRREQYKEKLSQQQEEFNKMQQLQKQKSK